MSATKLAAVRSMPPVDTAGAYLSDAQIDVLLRPIRPDRVSKDGKGFSHVEAYEIRAHLTRLFGFARWSQRVVSQDLVFEDSVERKDGKSAWTVCYRSLVELVVCAPDGTELAVYREGATGDATNMPSRADAHDMALKTSQSQALKRCAVNLGDQFGLGLYNRGSSAPLVRNLVTWVVPSEGEPPADPTEHVANLAPEASEAPDTSAREMSPPSPARPDARRAAVDPAPTPAVPAGGVPTAPSPVMDGHDGPPVGQASAGEPSRSSATSGDSPMGEVLGLLTAAGLQSPGEATKTLVRALELAAKARIRNDMVPGLEPRTTLQAHLLTRMRQASDAQRAANQTVGA